MVSQTEMYSEQGFSLLEFLLVLIILSLVAVIAIPGLSELTASFHRNNGLNAIEFDFRRARSEALSTGAQGVISVANDNRHYTVGLDTLPFGSPPTVEIELFRRELPNGVSINTGGDLYFDSRGFLVDSVGSLTSQSISILYDNTEYCSGDILSPGTFEIRCE